MQAEQAIPASRSDLHPPPPRSLSRGELVNISMGLLGVQIVWGLQNVNTTRIFQSLGAGMADLPILWIAAPITGLIVQPVVGYLSDRTRGRFGRRRPYLALGAVLSALALVVMGEATTLWSAIAALWMLTASVNIAMQPLRALMADMLPSGQRANGFAIQAVFIGVGAVVASALPWLLVNWFGVANSAEGSVSPVVRLAFRIGAIGLLLTAAWTVFTVREHRLGSAALPTPDPDGRSSPAPGPGLHQFAGAMWMTAGAGIAALTAAQNLRPELYLVAAIGFLFGAARCAVVAARRRGRAPAGLLEIVEDIIVMPLVLRRLALVQFFTWFGLFALWIYTVPAVAARYFGTGDAMSHAYQSAANWVGVQFAIYDGVAVLVALALPLLSGRMDLRQSHRLCLVLGAAGVAGIAVLARSRPVVDRFGRDRLCLGVDTVRPPMR